MDYLQTVEGFTCELLDEIGPVDCSTGSISFDGLLPGTHTFEVFAFTGDVVDPSPATFTWTIIPDTVIDSAVDGDGNELIDDVAPTSTSGSIDFEFSAELDGLPTTVEGFTCELLDEIGPVDCSTGSISFDDLDLGDHTFEVFAFTGDVVDPSPASFTWTIVEEEDDTPADDDDAADDDAADDDAADDDAADDDAADDDAAIHLPITITNLPITITNLPITITNLPITITNLPITITNLPITITNLPIMQDHPAAGNPQIPNEADGTPTSGATPFGNGPSPISPMTPQIDPAIPRDISVYVEQSQNAGPISAKYGTQVGNQCLLQLDSNQLLKTENMSQVRDQIISAENMSQLISKGISPITLDGQLDIYGEVSLSKTPISNQTTTNSTLDKKLSPINNTTTLKPENTTDTSFELLDLMTIGNVSIAKINNCNQTLLDKLGNFTVLNIGNNENVTKKQPAISSSNLTQLDLESITNVTKKQPDNNFTATTNDSLKSSPAFPSSGLNITWDADLTNSIRALTDNTINKSIDNLTKQMEENFTITKETLSNVTFYQFTPLDISRTLLNETINKLVGVNQTFLPQGINQTSQVVDTKQTNKTGSLPGEDSEPIDIVIVDTGVSLTHPDLSVYRSLSFVNGNLSTNTDLTDDKNGHGSHIAGIINAKDNGFGIVGIVPEDNIRIWSLKVCGDDGICSLSDQIKAIEYITNNADIIDIVNYSIENPYSKLFEQAISESVKSGITYVAAAGNFGKNATLTTSPASSPDVITVSAIGDSDGKCGGLGPLLDRGTMMDDTFANFSNFGPSIDVAAPGVDILSTFNGTAYGILTGTSMAVPHVTGLAGYLKTINPNASPEEIREMIIKSGSSPSSECQENKGIGYFKGDLDEIPEPLLILPKNLIRDDLINRAEATNNNNIITNATKQETTSNTNKN